ncbi:MAG: FAD-dependent oxidoreductase [bacterium]
MLVNHAILKGKEILTEDIATLYLDIKDEGFVYTPGQYVSVALPHHPHILQEKAYTISNIPSDRYIALTIKKMGIFSGALHELPIGASLLLSEPQGNFFPAPDMQNIVFLAAGIGITPFYSIIRHQAEIHDNTARITLIYTVRIPSQSAFIQNFTELQNTWENFSFILHRTDQKERLTADTIQKLIPVSPDPYFFICGPNSFVADLWKGLRKNGIAENHIILESFF